MNAKHTSNSSPPFTTPLHDLESEIGHTRRIIKEPDFPFSRDGLRNIVAVGFLLLVLFAISQYNFLLFHALAELFSIAVAWGLFMMVWNSRRFINNDALVYLGIAYLFIGLIDLIHTLAYKGMGIFPESLGANSATQLWIAARAIESLSLLVFSLLIGKRFPLRRAVIAYVLVCAAVFATVFIWPVFPDCYLPDVGLTMFKKVMEYCICLLLGLALIIFCRKRTQIQATVFPLMVAAIACTMVGELAFTVYVDVYDLSNVIGHFAKMLSCYCIYLALIRSGLTQPYAVLFRKWLQSEQSFQQLIEAIPFSIMRFDAQGRVTYVNPFHLMTFAAGRLSAESFIGRRIHELPGIVKAGIGGEIVRVLAGELISLPSVYFPEFSGGHSGYQNIWAVPIFEAGRMTGGFLLREDATERIQRDQLFSQALQTTPNGFWVIDDQGRIRECNAAAVEMTGYSEDELKRMHVVDIVADSTVEEVLARMETMRREGHARFTSRHRRKDGVLLNVEVNATFLAQDNGYFVVAVRDITEEVKKQEALIRSEEKFGRAFRRSPMLMTISDVETGVCLDLNDAFIRATGYTRKDCIGKSSVELGFMAKEVREQLRDMLIRNRRVSGEILYLRKKDGSPLICEYWAELIRIDDKSRLLSIANDITEKQQVDHLLKTRLFLSEYADTHSLQDVLQRTLDQTELLTNSRIGFFHFVDHDQQLVKLHLWSKNTSSSVCRVDRAERHYPIDKAGVWADAIRENRPIIHNDYPSLPCKKGLPPGHAEVVREMVIPVLRDGKAVALLGVGNKPSLYTEEDVRIATELVNMAWDIVARKQSEVALAQSRRALQALVGNLPGIAFQCRMDAAWTMLYISEGCHKLTGYEPAAFIDNRLLSFREIIHLDNRQLVVDQIQAAVKTKSGYEIEYRIIDRHGCEKWVWEKGALTNDSGNTSTVMEGFITDITERKIAEQQLQLQSLVLNQINDQVVITDLEGAITYVNAAERKALGYGTNELIGQSVDFLGEDGEFGATQREIKERTLAEGAWRGEVVNFTKDGIRIVLDCRTTLVRDHQGKPVAMCGVSTDITKSKQRQNELLRLATAIDQAAESIMITDPDGKIVFVNPSFERISGYSSEEMLNRSPVFLKSGKHPHSFYQQIRETISNGQVWTGQITNRKKDGSLYTEKATISPVFDERGKLINFVAVKNDITEELRQDERLRQAQKMEAIGTLAGGIAHDFNNILFPMVGFAEMLCDDLPSESKPHEYASDILASALRAKDLVQQILTFSRPSDGERKVIRLQDVIQEALKLVRASLPSNIIIEQHIDRSCPPILADATKIHQIVMNLATNAYHAMEGQGGVLAMRLRQVTIDENGGWDEGNLAPGSYLCLSVSDTGTGIDRALLDRIFEPYFTSKEEGKGTGLGLSVVHGIVRSYHGDISVESEPGNGSTFHVYLPSITQKQPSAPAVISDRIKGGDEHILLVDDEVSIISMQRGMLERRGYRITAFATSSEALESFKANPFDFDLVITDMTMPVMTGDRLTQEIKRIRPDIPVILCSGFYNRMDEQRAREVGAHGFLFKPIRIREIAHIVRDALDTGTASATDTDKE